MPDMLTRLVPTQVSMAGILTKTLLTGTLGLVDLVRRVVALWAIMPIFVLGVTAGLPWPACRKVGVRRSSPVAVVDPHSSPSLRYTVG